MAAEDAPHDAAQHGTVTGKEHEPDTVERRKVLAAMGAAGALALFPRFAHAQAPGHADATLSLQPATAARVIPAGYTGLSYEIAQLSEPAFFSTQNTGLVQLMRRLSPKGILRLGGNSSEFSWLALTAATQPPVLAQASGSLPQTWMPHRLFRIAPEAVHRLAGFLDATGWSVIYGLNLGHGSPQRAADEAAFVSQVLGSRIAFFQIGNEPDFYGDAINRTRPADWDFARYAAQWLQFAEAVRARVPQARFGGPDVGSSSNWVAEFARQVAPRMGGSIVALTSHYYAEGPPNDPRVTIARLLAGNPAVAAATAGSVHEAAAHGMRYHMTEGNTCYRGGKPGMSNAFASALWAADYMLLLASLGCAGVNLHGGDSRFIAAGLGNHNPGLKVEHAAGGAPNAFYTPIQTELGQVPAPRPIYYGMLFAQQFAGSTLQPCTLSGGANLTAYAASHGRETRIALINKDAAQTVTVQVPGRWKRADVWWLAGPALDATSGVTLGGSSVADDGRWQPKTQAVPIDRRGATVTLPPARAALLFLA